MTLDELEHHERVVLLALLGLMARIDLQASPEEVGLLKRVMADMGPEHFEKVVQEAGRLPDAAAILEAAQGVTRPEAREVMYELLYDMAVPDTIVPEEAKLLDQVAEMWDLPRRVGLSG